MRIQYWLSLWVAAWLLCSAAADANQVHVVESNHSLWSIAKRYGVSVKAIKALNGLKGDTIRAGQKLKIPKKGGDPKPATEKKPATDKPAANAESSSDPNWVNAKPAAHTQTQKTAKERGVNPCNTPDPGQGIYTRWDRAPSIGQMIMPERGGVTRAGSFDVMVHFHGHEPVRKEWVKAMDGAVLVGIDLGIGSGPYLNTFSSPAVFTRLIESVEKRVASYTGREKAKVRKLGLSAWSAGYGAVEAILRSSPYAKRVDTVILLDGLHSTPTEPMKSKQLEPFVNFAKQAAKGQKFMFVSHSSIIPPGYTSTTETANYLIDKLGGKPRTTKRQDLMGLEMHSRYTRGNFHVRGYSGNDKMDHCAHIGLLKDVLNVHVKRRWQSPKGRSAPKAKTSDQATAQR